MFWLCRLSLSLVYNVATGHKTTQWTLKSDFVRANLTTPSLLYLRSGHKIIWRKIPRSGRRHCGWRVGRLITFTFRPAGALSITIPIPYLPSTTPLSIARPPFLIVRTSKIWGRVKILLIYQRVADYVTFSAGHGGINIFEGEVCTLFTVQSWHFKFNL